jgi:mono/diheme cytochrome c family protein
MITLCVFFAALSIRAQPTAGSPAPGGKWLSDLGCLQCHTDLPGESTIRQQAPELSHAGLRYRTSYLLAFLQKPQRVRRHIGHARMPDFRLNERDALALALFLEQQREPVNWPELPDELRKVIGAPVAAVSRSDFDRTLASGLACLTCHTLNGQGGPLGPELGSVGHQLHPAWIKSYLAAPAMFGVPTNVMPSQFYRLSQDGKKYEPLIPQADRAIATLADHLTSIGAERRAELDEKLAVARKTHPQSTAALGEQLFRAFNCAACHRHAFIQPREQAAPALASEGMRVQKTWLESYLRYPVALRRAGYNPGDGSRMPDFHLAEDEARAVADELMRQRTPLPGLKTNFTARPLSAFARDKALHLLQDKLSCLGCHRLGDQGGVLGPDLGLVSSRLQPSYAFSIIAQPRQLAPHSIMPQVPMPPESVELIVRYLLMDSWTNGPAQYLSPIELPLVPTLAEFAPRTRSVRLNYLRHCAGCHGVEGRGDGFNAPFLLPSKPTVFADSIYLGQRPDDTLFDGIHSGGRILNRSPLMPAWGTTFSGSELRELVSHLRTFCQCEGPQWSRDGSDK